MTDKIDEEFKNINKQNSIRKTRARKTFQIVVFLASDMANYINGEIYMLTVECIWLHSYE